MLTLAQAIAIAAPFLAAIAIDVNTTRALKRQARRDREARTLRPSTPNPFAPTADPIVAMVDGIRVRRSQMGQRVTRQAS